MEELTKYSYTKQIHLHMQTICLRLCALINNIHSATTQLITIWYKNFKWNLICSFTVSGRSVKLKYVNWIEIYYVLYCHDTENKTGLP